MNKHIDVRSDYSLAVVIQHIASTERMETVVSIAASMFDTSKPASTLSRNLYAEYSAI